jgi:excinuclease ABC subunit A
MRLRPVARRNRARLDYLDRVGLGYLTLTASRAHSAAKCSASISPRRWHSLTNAVRAGRTVDRPASARHGPVIGVMQRLRDAGNCWWWSTIRRSCSRQTASHIGPGPGERGGEVVFFTPSELAHNGKSLTGDYLSGRKRAHADIEPVPIDAKAARLEIFGAAEHNLKRIDVAIPLNRLVCITGVSGSGKSTLIQDVLYAALLKHKGKPTELPGAHRAIRGHERIAEVVMVDQTPIGRTTRSNPASYVGAWDPIRALYAKEPAAKERGYTPGTFSFNSAAAAVRPAAAMAEHVEMQFLSDVYLRCPDCDGKRFRAEVLELTVKGKSIADVLDMTVSEAAYFSPAALMSSHGCNRWWMWV